MICRENAVSPGLFLLCFDFLLGLCSLTQSHHVYPPFVLFSNYVLYVHHTEWLAPHQPVGAGGSGGGLDTDRPQCYGVLVIIKIIPGIGPVKAV